MTRNRVSVEEVSGEESKSRKRKSVERESESERERGEKKLNKEIWRGVWIGKLKMKTK